MGKCYYTIGMAGHIDHGKTTLTKALTNVDTDRLKEEKERQISIELGFAPFELDESMQVSIIDVPGHERFIRQMIAGVAGIDLVLLVVAADEGIMPQTKEHLEILSFLRIEHGIVVISKIDKVEEDFIDLVRDEIKDQLAETVFAEVPIVLVDSLTKKGIDTLKNEVKKHLKKIKPRNNHGAFRLPIDQVFTLRGQGTVVRGTIYEGMVQQGEQLTVLPIKRDVRARQLQVHHQATEHAVAGQRVAINLSGISKEDLKRGDVLVSSNTFVVTETIDISLRIVDKLKFPLKQRSPIKCHIGTAEVMGKIIFFDRNEAENTLDEILCQLRLDMPVVTKRGDRFILRRPTPVETVGGGWVIDPIGKKYRFGDETKSMLHEKKEGTPTERLVQILENEKILSFNEMLKMSSLDEASLHTILLEKCFIEIDKEVFSTTSIYQELTNLIHTILRDFHTQHPMKFGLNKAELIQQISSIYPKQLITFALEKGEQEGIYERVDQFVKNNDFDPHYPHVWAKRIEGLITDMKSDQLAVKLWEDYVKSSGIPKDLGEEVKHFLLDKKEILKLDEKTYLHCESLNDAVARLKQNTQHEFEIKEAKEILQLSRKYLVPLLELLDRLKLTMRVENKRKWN